MLTVIHEMHNNTCHLLLFFAWTYVHSYSNIVLYLLYFADYGLCMQDGTSYVSVAVTDNKR
jgi:hypothetical protein